MFVEAVFTEQNEDNLSKLRMVMPNNMKPILVKSGLLSELCEASRPGCTVFSSNSNKFSENWSG